MRAPLRLPCMSYSPFSEDCSVKSPWPLASVEREESWECVGAPSA